MTSGDVMHWIALQPQPDEGGDALAALGWWALQFSPKVARLEDALVLEVSGSERLWGGRPLLRSQIIESNKPVALSKYAQGATSLIAMARLHAVGLARTVPDKLPLAALAAARPHLATLQKIGCSCWGELRALPRGGVARRFGAPLLAALDRAYGETPDIYPWLRVPEVFDATLELDAQVESAPALLFVARRLLGSLQAWLQAQHRGVLVFELIWTMDARRDTATEGQLVVRTAEPTRDMAHLQRLLGEHLARVTLPAPALYLRLRSLETQALQDRSASWLPDAQQTGDSLQQLLERLSARLGSQQVLHCQTRADHRPEQMQVWVPAACATKFIASDAINTWARGQKNTKKEGLYPTWLLAEPLKLVVRRNNPLYQGALTLIAGPQRIEAGWWGGGECALRDYFLARSAQAGLLWIYRERLAGRDGAGGGADTEPEWYLHGIFA